MKKYILSFLLTFLFIQWSTAQTPKWADKAKRAVFSIVTYDEENKILHTGNGFFVSENGIALSDYSLFKGAERAIILTTEGKEMAVKNILGANEMYDVIKFRVQTEKKVPALEIAATVPAKGAEVFRLPYSTEKNPHCTQGKIEEIVPIPGGYSYYTLLMPYSEKTISCPITNAEGQVIGMVQADTSEKQNICYAIGAPFIENLSISALSVNDAALQSIGIPKGLPEKEDQALTYLYLSASTCAPEQYLNLIDEFIEQFPQSADGYLQRATLYINHFKDKEHFEQAEKDLEQAMKLASNKDDIHFNTGRLMYANEINQPKFEYKDWGYAKALQEIQKALAIRSLPLYKQQEGDIYFAMKEYDKAYECYQKVNQSNLVSAETYYSAAKAKELMGGQPEEIIALLDSAIAAYPTPLPDAAAPYLLERARVKDENGHYREAVADYNLYYETVKGEVNDVFYYYREQASYKGKMFKQALEDIQKALNIKPDDAIYLAESGAVNLRVGRYEEAIENLKEALKIDPQFASCYRLIGFCQLQLGNKPEACENFSKAKELGDEAVNNLIEKNCQ